MLRTPYTLTGKDKDLLNALVHDLATEIDLHYEDQDFYALSGSFSLLKQALALLERADCRIHPDIRAVIARYNRTSQ